MIISKRFTLVPLSWLLCAFQAVGAATSSATPADSLRGFVFGLPKAELHVHLEGTMEPELYLALAKRNGITSAYKTPEDVRQRMREARDMPGFIVIYEELIAAARTEQDFHDIALAYFKKAHSQGVVYVEMFFDPQLHTERGVALATIYAGLERAHREALDELGLESHYILSFLRDRPAADAARVLEESRPWLPQLIGVGLDNPEVPDFPKKFQQVFERARALGLHLTAHCDVDQPDTVAHHWGALDVLHVERIDHGLKVLDDPKLIEAVRDRHIGLTAAPTLLTRDIPGRMEARATAVKKLLQLGLLVSINSDDPGMKRGLYVGDLILRVEQTVGLTRAELVQLARNSFIAAWMPQERRAVYLAAVDRYLERFPIE